jgi:hypothetical protein
MAAVTAVVAAKFATPNGNKWTRVAVGAAPGENVTVGALDDGEDVTGALVCHDYCFEVCFFRVLNKSDSKSAA